MSNPIKRGIDMDQYDKYAEKSYSEHLQESEPEVNHEITPYEIGKNFGRVGTQVLFNLPFNEVE